MGRTFVGGRDGGAAQGLLILLSANLLWGFLPIYWRAVAWVPAAEIVAHRAIWSVAFVAVVVVASRRWGALRAAMADRRALLALLATTAIMSFNWGLFLWAVNSGRVLEVSLGYYINPLVNVVLGLVILRETLNRWQAVSVVLAAAGILVMIAGVGLLPWVSLLLAMTFGVYGLIRKVIAVDAATGLAVETALMTVPAAVYLVWLYSVTGTGAVEDGQGILWLALSGPATAVPLLLWTVAARRLRYVTVGVLQYLVPTCHFGLAVFVYGETFTMLHLAAFAFIWGALAIYTIDAIRRAPRRTVQARTRPEGVPR